MQKSYQKYANFIRVRWDSDIPYTWVLLIAIYYFY